MNAVQQIERRIVRHLIREAGKLGYRPSRVDNGDDFVPVFSEEQTMEEAFAADDARIIFEGDDEQHWVYLVLGNDGWDVISDYGYVPNKDGGVDESHPWNQLMERMNQYADALGENA